LERFQDIVEFALLKVAGFGVGFISAGEVGEQPFEKDAIRLTHYARQPHCLLRLDTQAAHASIDFQVQPG
jgi:hypothetical protein